MRVQLPLWLRNIFKILFDNLLIDCDIIVEWLNNQTKGDSIMATVKKIAYYQDQSIPLRVRVKAFAQEMLLIAIFKDKAYANKWYKINCPR